MAVAVVVVFATKPSRMTPLMLIIKSQSLITPYMEACCKAAMTAQFPDIFLCFGFMPCLAMLAGSQHLLRRQRGYRIQVAA